MSILVIYCDAEWVNLNGDFISIHRPRVWLCILYWILCIIVEKCVSKESIGNNIYTLYTVQRIRYTFLLR